MRSKNRKVHNKPLVSIIVIAYNSSIFVLETLESVKAQSYQNIELIISDDCSTDDTVKICREWIAENRERFIHTEIITSLTNGGVPSNCNRGIHEAKGEWIKLIAADDILTKDSIQLFVGFCHANKNAKIISSISLPFIQTNGKRKYGRPIIGDRLFFHEKITSKNQYKILLYQCVIHAPNVFFKSDLIKIIGGFDEKYKLMEDYPFWIKTTQCGYKFYKLNRITVHYRIHSQSIYNKKIKKRIFNDFYLCKKEFEKEYIYPNISQTGKLFYKFEFFRKKLFNILGLNRDYFLLKILYYSTRLLSPINLYTFFLKYTIYVKIKRSND